MYYFLINFLLQGVTFVRVHPLNRYNQITNQMEINGTTYKDETPIEVVTILERCRQNNTRIVLEYGDTKTGQGWGDNYGVSGRVGRSTGTNKIPLMIANTRSHGGGAILDHCIVSIKTSIGKVSLYAHPNYKTGRKS